MRRNLFAGLIIAVAAGLALGGSAAARSYGARGAARADVCQLRYPSGTQKTVGKMTLFDRQASLYQVCEGFGAPDRFTLTPTMQCAIIAAAATYGGPVVNVGVSGGCTGGEFVTAFRTGKWLGFAKSVGCGYFSDIFAGSVGIFVAGATSATGPGAVAIGVATYRALAAGLKLVCGGVFTGLPTELGRQLEAKHETAVAVDVVRHGKCISERRRAILGIQWSAASCPASRDTLAPSTPTGLNLADRGTNALKLGWQRSTDNVGVNGYRVYRNAEYLGQTTGTEWNFANLACGATYALGVAAVDSAGNASARAVLTASTAQCASGRPSTPTGTRITSAGSSSLTLSWTATGAIGYRLYRNDTHVATIQETSYTFSGLSCGTSYKLGVQSTNSGNLDSSGWSGVASVSASTSACASPPATTYAETTGGVAHTWTNYLNAGGTQGPTIAAFTTIRVACKLAGFRVADGNTWWYRIASSPWSNKYYVSADAFYNNGQTSGSLHGTPFVDPKVPNC